MAPLSLFCRVRKEGEEVGGREEEGEEEEAIKVDASLRRSPNWRRRRRRMERGRDGGWPI